MNLSLDEALGLFDTWRLLKAPISLDVNRGTSSWDGVVIATSPGSGSVTLSLAAEGQRRILPLNSARLSESHGQGSFSILAQYPNGDRLLFSSPVAFGTFAD